MDKAAPRDMDGDRSEPRYFGPWGVAVVVILSAVLALVPAFVGYLVLVCGYSSEDCTTTLLASQDSDELRSLLAPNALEIINLTLSAAFEMAIAGVVVAAAYWRSRGRVTVLLGLERPVDWAVFKRALLLTLTLIVVMSPTEILFPQLRDIFVLPKTSIGISVFMFLVIVVAPICEETLFRGFMYSNLRAWYSFGVSNLVVSAVFALAHAPTSLLCVPLVLPIGILLGWVRERAGSIVPAIALHALYNASAFVTELIFR